jgi:hypothetical protein
MPNLFMGEDAYRFEPVVVNRLIRPGVPGNFALGLMDEGGEFVPKLIGRSDTDLRLELLTMSQNPPYPYFKFAISRRENAYEMECANFHSFQGKLDNKTHPVPPAGSDLKCLLCGK